MDGTRIFLNLFPAKGYVVNVEKALKLKNRISIIPISNADGTQKFKPLIIGKFGRSQC